MLSQSDPILGNIIQSMDEPITVSTNDVFFDLMSCILEQQIHYRSTKKKFQKMLDRAELKTLNPSNFSEFEEKAFPSMKISIAKIETVLKILEFWNKHTINWKSLTDAEVIEQLTSIKGVGKWTIDMILLYTLERPNVFPYDDFHLKQIMVKHYDLNPKSKLKAQMIDIANDWGDQKSLAVKYLLAWKEHHKKIVRK
jgi:DNA-3-methyladenine glycosylase II